MLKKIQSLVFFAVVSIFISLLILIAIELVSRKMNSSESKSSSLKSHPAYAGYHWVKDFEKDLAKRSKQFFSSKPYVPYSLWKEYPYQSDLFNINADGYRKTVHSQLSKDGPKKSLLFMGGSTLFSSQVPDEDTIPSLVAKKLGAKYADIDFDVKNLGIDGMLSTQEMHHLLELLKNNESIDYVVFYDGINDVFNHVIANVPHTFFDRFGTVLNRKEALKELFFSLIQKLSVVQNFSPQKVNYDTNPSVLEKRLRKMIDDYKEQIRIINLLSKEYNFQPFFVWQPNLFCTKKKLTESEKEILAGTNKAVEQAFDLACKQVPLELKAVENFIDCSACFDQIQSSIFVDPYHVTSRGNEAIATKILDFFGD